MVSVRIVNGSETSHYLCVDPIRNRPGIGAVGKAERERLQIMEINQRRICHVFVFHILFVCSIRGLSLYPASDLTADKFTLVCDLQGATWMNVILFSRNGSSAGGCSSPPNPTCSSNLGNITWDTQTVNFTLSQDKILDNGNALWVCTHGTVTAAMNATVIALCMNGKISFEDKIAVSCSCGFPSVEADVEYKDSKDGMLIGKQTFVLGSSSDSQCSSDNRSMDFSSYIENYPSKTKEVCATIRTFSQISTPDKTCAGCKYSDAELFLGGFSCFLIEFGITSIIMLIFLFCKMLSKIFGDKKANKIIIIVLFNSFALILGFALGFGLKECDKRDLGLGLGLGFGFILAIALVLTLYIYHKQCGSKKENEDENRKPENNPQRVGSPASTSNIKMESKLKS